MSKTPKRFVQIEKTSVVGGHVVDVLVDCQTRVQYLLFAGAGGGGLTPLLDAEGKPLLFDGDLPA